MPSRSATRVMVYLCKAGSPESHGSGSSLPPCHVQPPCPSSHPVTPSSGLTHSELSLSPSHTAVHTSPLVFLPLTCPHLEHP